MKYYIALALSILPYISNAQDFDNILMLNLSMHTGSINRVDVDKSERFVLTCSNDKTAKIWDLRSGNLIHTIRVPVNSEDEGKLYAGAFSPNGQLIALGGYTGITRNIKGCIYIVDTKQYRIIHRITGTGGTIADMKFTPDGRYLIAVINDRIGYKIWDTGNWAEINGSQPNDTFPSMCNQMAFTNGNGFILTCNDNYIRKYDNSFRLVRKIKVDGKYPNGVSVSGDKSKIAIAYYRQLNVEVYDSNLNLLYKPSLEGIKVEKPMNHISFSIQNNELVAGGYLAKKNENDFERRYLRKWSENGKGGYVDILATENTVSDIKSLSNGGFIYAGFRADWGIINRAGNNVLYHKSQLSDLGQDDRSQFKMSYDGQVIGITPNEENPFFFNVEMRTFFWDQKSIQPGFKDSIKSIRLSNWQENYGLKLNGESLNVLGEFERCRAVDIDENKEVFYVATNYGIYCFDKNGRKVYFINTASTVHGVRCSADGKLLASISSDGLIKWYNAVTGSHLLSLLVLRESKQWFFFTPNGFYDCSKGAESSIGWCKNNITDFNPVFSTLFTSANINYRPDIIDLVLKLGSVEEAVKIADERKVYNDMMKSEKLNK